jgi:hypothetical protein
MKMSILSLAMTLIFVCSGAAQQGYDQGTILKWAVEAYGKNKEASQNAAVYYVQVGANVYRVTDGKTKPGSNAANVGKPVQCRVKKDHMFVVDQKVKEVKYSIIGVSAAQ